MTEPISLSPLAAILAIHLQCPENRRHDPRPSKVAVLRSDGKRGAGVEDQTVEP